MAKASKNLPQYVSMNRGGYRVRMVVPEDLRGLVGKTYLEKRLGSDKKTALQNSYAVIADFQAQIEDARQRREMELQRQERQKPSLAHAAKVFYAKMLEMSDKGRAVMPINDEAQRDFKKFSQSIYANKLRLLVANQISMEEAEALIGFGADYLIEHNLIGKPTVQERREILQALAEVQLDVLAADQSRDNGVVHDPEPRSKILNAPEPTPTNEKPGLTLRQLLDAYLANPSRKANERTNKSYGVHFRLMTDVLGENRDVKSITREDFRRVRDILVKMPVNAQSSKLFKGKSALEVVELAEGQSVPTLSASSINNRLEFISAIFKFAEEENYVEKNLARGLKVAGEKKAKDRRKSFTIEDLNKIFSAPLYAGCLNDGRGYAKPGTRIVKRGRYWVPLIALWTGMRLGECCQLHSSDIKKIDDVWCIIIQETKDGNDIEDADRKRVKTDAGERYVPIHSELIKLGFVNFALEQQKTKYVRLFPELKLDATGYLSGTFAKWFNGENRFLDKVGVWKKNEKVFHSFRHTYRDAMSYARLTPDVIMALGGWSSGDTKDIYGGQLSPKFLKEQIEKISFPGLKNP
nr:tyrosine-type recombinase/integrase [uncultured Cohaesibacter sp.]